MGKKRTPAQRRRMSEAQVKRHQKERAKKRREAEARGGVDRLAAFVETESAKREQPTRGDSGNGQAGNGSAAFDSFITAARTKDGDYRRTVAALAAASSLIDICGRDLVVAVQVVRACFGDAGVRLGASPRGGRIYGTYIEDADD